MTIRQLLVISASAFCVSTLPCQAGPCSSDIELLQSKIDAKLNANAAAGPTAGQSAAGQMHRQPTPNSIAQAEAKLGDVSAGAADTVKEAMARARQADSAGDKAACERALADAQRAMGLAKF